LLVYGYIVVLVYDELLMLWLNESEASTGIGAGAGKLSATRQNYTRQQDE